MLQVYFHSVAKFRITFEADNYEKYNIEINERKKIKCQLSFLNLVNFDHIKSTLILFTFIK